MWGDDDFFDGPGRRSRVNLSTTTASSSTSLLSNVKRERLAREQRRREEKAAATIQRIWRGRREAVLSRRRLLDDLEGESGVERRGRGLVGLLKTGAGTDQARVRGVMVSWSEAAVQLKGESGLAWVPLCIDVILDGRPAFIGLLYEQRGYPSVIVIALLAVHAIRAVADAPG